LVLGEAERVVAHYIGCKFPIRTTTGRDVSLKMFYTNPEVSSACLRADIVYLWAWAARPII